MSENYAVINGKKIELTDEQAKALDVETKTNPFNRVGLGSYCYVPCIDGTVATYTENYGPSVDRMHRYCNYFNDKDFTKQVALHQLLYRKLLKFSYDDGCEDKEWNGTNDHWIILYHKSHDAFAVVNAHAAKELTVHFSTEEGASRAIKEVIRPFMKEHPDFVW